VLKCSATKKTQHNSSNINSTVTDSNDSKKDDISNNEFRRIHIRMNNHFREDMNKCLNEFKDNINKHVR
jgi:hypothetical protein